MPERWLQIKGDPSVRAFLFEQKRIESLFDVSIDRVHDIVRTMLMRKGVFHVKIHYSSSQITCWFARDPFCYEKFVREEALADDFVERFPETDHAGRTPVLGADEIDRILGEFRRLRLTDENLYLRNAAINLINGMINMTFSCDGTHYIDHHTFFAKLDRFETPARS
ncbi:MAG: hypothetical protein PVJ15_05480 [Gammaproteobacteria bacterium]|jgi:hypothetical protein